MLGDCDEGDTTDETEDADSLKTGDGMTDESVDDANDDKAVCMVVLLLCVVDEKSGGCSNSVPFEANKIFNATNLT